jgi:hypothetical protein
MLAFPAEWAQETGPQVVTAIPPNLGARFRYTERVRPCPRFGQIVDRVLERDPWFRVTDIGPMRRIVTLEGEYGAWVRIDGLRKGAPATRFVGAVLTEDFASVLECVALDPVHAMALQVESLTLLRGVTLGLGRRPRHFFYVPPPGWQGLPSGPATSWYPPGFPADLTTIVVPAAIPITGTAEQAVEDVVGGLAAGLSEQTRTQTEVSGHATGTWVRVCGVREGGASLTREAAVFVVDGVRYTARLETARTDQLTELHETFMELVRSIHPLPSASELQLGEAFARSSDAFDHWAT